MKITRELLRRWCAGYTDEKIATLVPEAGLTPLEIAALDIPVEDRLRVLLREELIPARDLRLLACGWAESACAKTGWDDARSIASIAVARRFAVGEATESERVEAASAAWSAVAAWSVQSAAVRAAAWSVDRSAWSARSVAEAAAEAYAYAAYASSALVALSAWSAWSAAWAATRAAQLADVVRLLKRIDEAAKGVVRHE